MRTPILSRQLFLPFRDRWFLGIVLLVIVFGVFYNTTLLLAHDVDESRHMNYIKLLLDEQRLPYIISTQPYEEYKGAHAFHPPLYYLVLLPFYAAVRGLPDELAWHLVRVLSLLICLAALPLIYQIAQRVGLSQNDKTSGENEVYENSRAAKIFARLVVAQVALIPMFGMTANMVNSDSACFLAVTVFLWLLIVKYPQDRGLKSALVLGIVWGLGALTKSTALLCNGVALVLYLIAQDGKMVWKSQRAWTRFGIACLCLVVIAGWWHVRSHMLYGSFMPVPPSMPTPALPSPQHGTLVMMLHDNFPLLFAFANWGLFSTLWSQKEWIPQSIRNPVYFVLALYSLTALAGVIFSKLRKPEKRPGIVVSKAGAASPAILAQKIALWTTYSIFVVTWITVLQVALFWHWGWAEGGRYLFPAIGGLSLFLAYGWRAFLKTNGLQYLTAAWIVGMVALNATAIYWLITYLNPTFGP